MPKKAPPRLDAYGDPLPVDVRARIGTGRLVAGDVMGLALSADGALLAEGERSGHICVSGCADGKRRFRVRGPSANQKRDGRTVEQVAFSPDGTRLAASYRDFVALWKVGTKSAELLWEARVTTIGWSRSIAFSPDGTMIASANGTCVLAASDGSVLATSELRADSVAFSPDGATVAIGRNRTVTLASASDLFGRQSADIAPLADQTVLQTLNDFVVVRFSRDGSRVLAAIVEDALYVLDAATLAVLERHPWPSDAVHFPTRIAVDDRTVVCADERVFRLENGAFRDLDIPLARLVATSADGATLAVQRYAGLAFIDLFRHPVGEPITPMHAFRRAVGDLGWADEDGEPALVVTEPSRVSWHRPSTGALVRETPFPAGWPLCLDVAGARIVNREERERDRLRRLDGSLVRDLGDERIRKLSPDGKTWLAQRREGKIHTLFVGDGETERALFTSADSIYGTAFSPDGRLVAAGYYGSYGVIWNVATGEQVGLLPVRFIWQIAWSPFGGRVLVSAYGGAVKMIVAGASEWSLEIEAQRGLAGALAWSPDGQRFATSGPPTRVWNLEGERVHELPGCANWLSFTPDGTGLVVASDGVVETWDLPAP